MEKDNKMILNIKNLVFKKKPVRKLVDWYVDLITSHFCYIYSNPWITFFFSSTLSDFFQYKSYLLFLISEDY